MAETILLDDLEIYQLAISIGDTVWNIIADWDLFAKETVGKQLVRAVDSISANIAEGYGRYFFKDRKQFCYYSRGSLMETKAWLTKSHNRGLIDDIKYDQLLCALKELHLKLNRFIKSLKQNATS